LFLLRLRKLPLRLALFVFATLGATLALTACGDRYPPSTPLGTYTFNISALAAAAGLTHDIPITLNVRQ
jgi:hypothetical protein